MKLSLGGMELSKEHTKIISEFGGISAKKMKFLDELFIKRFEEFLEGKLKELDITIHDKFAEHEGAYFPMAEGDENIPAEKLRDSVKDIIDEVFKVQK